MKVTASEKKLVEAYRTADAENKKIAMKVLKGEYGSTITGLLNMAGGGSTSSSAGTNLGETIGNLLK
jgi:acetylglutamate kinase